MRGIQFYRSAAGPTKIFFGGSNWVRRGVPCSPKVRRGSAAGPPRTQAGPRQSGGLVRQEKVAVVRGGHFRVESSTRGQLHRGLLHEARTYPQRTSPPENSAADNSAADNSAETPPWSAPPLRGLSSRTNPPHVDKKSAADKSTDFLGGLSWRTFLADFLGGLVRHSAVDPLGSAADPRRTFRPLWTARGTQLDQPKNIFVGPTPDFRNSNAGPTQVRHGSTAD